MSVERGPTCRLVVSCRRSRSQDAPSSIKACSRAAGRSLYWGHRPTGQEDGTRLVTRTPLSGKSSATLQAAFWLLSVALVRAAAASALVHTQQGLVRGV